MRVSLLLVLAFAGTVCAESPFVGTWKINRDKTQFDKNSVTKIETDGTGIKYIGSGTAVYGGALDGAERPGLGAFAKDTFILKKSSDRGYESLQSRNGKNTVRHTVEASPDGKTLTASFTPLTPRKDGKNPTITYTYKRVGGDGKPYAFLGTWKLDPKLTKWSEDPQPMTITEAGGVLTMNNAAQDITTTVDLAKGDVTVTGGNPATDVTRTAKKLDDRSIQVSTTRAGHTTTSVYKVRPDGKTMTIAFTSTGEDGKPTTTTTVYDKQ